MSVAEDILDGMFCEGCGEFIGEPVGYPRKCEECEPHKKRRSKKHKVVNTQFDASLKGWHSYSSKGGSR